MDTYLQNSNPITLTINQPLDQDNNAKSLFEKRILLAFKSTNPKDILLQLISSSKILIHSIKQQLKEIQSEDSNHSMNIIITLNIIEKLRRISLRNMLDVNIQIGKIYEILFRESYHHILISTDIKILIALSNEVLSILSKLKGTKVFHLLRKECYLFLQLIINNDDDGRLNKEQSESIKDELKMFDYLNGSPIANHNSNKDWNEEGINLPYLNSEYDNKINLLYHHCLDSLMKMEYPEEGYQFLSLYGFGLYQLILNNLNINNYQWYLNIGIILTHYLISPQYRLISTPSQSQSQSQKRIANIIKAKDSILSMIDFSKDGINLFIEEYINKEYELDIHFKLIEDLYELCYLYLNRIASVLTINELSDIFFVLLKRIYFTFPTKQSCLTALIIHFYSINYNSSLPKKYQEFLKYILYASSSLENSILKNKLILLYPQYQYNEGSINNVDNIQSEDIDIFNLSQMSFGYNCRCSIEAGKEWSILIEIDKALSILYLWLMIENYDITVQIMKYNSNERNKEFVLMKQFDKVKLTNTDKHFELVYLLTEPGIYKIVFDNIYSWFKSKDISYNIKVLKPIESSSTSNNKSNSGIDWNEYMSRYHYIKYSHSKSMIPLIQIKENIIQSQMNFIVIPLLYNPINGTISIYKNNSNNTDLLIQINKDDKIDNQMIIYNALKKYYSYHNSLTIFKAKTIIINCFIMESCINSNILIDSKSLLSNCYSIIANESQYRNITLNYFNLSISCLEYTLYQKSIHYEGNSSLLHIHITPTSFYPSLHLNNENADLSNKVTLLKYTNEINSIESFIETIKSILLKPFEINITYSDTSFQAVNCIREAIKSNIKDMKEVYIYDYAYLNDVLHLAHILCENL